MESAIMKAASMEPTGKPAAMKPTSTEPMSAATTTTGERRG
jgi:hypothetical protein